MLPHYSDIIKVLESTPHDTNKPNESLSFDTNEFSFSMGDSHGDPNLDDCIAQSSSEINTSQSNNLPTLSEPQHPVPEWTNPDSAVKDTYAEMGSSNQTPTSLAWDIKEILYSRFGFSSLDSEAPSGGSDLPWATVSKVIGLAKVFIPEACCPVIQVFVTKMINNATDARAIRTIVDLNISTNAASPLRNLCHNLFVVTPMTSHKTTCYLLSADNSQTPQPCWQLTINDPTAVLQCFRVDLGSSLQNAARSLLAHGISFNMFTCHADLSHELLGTNTERVYTPHSLGWHPADHKPGPREYIIYKELRDRLLSCPYHCAALLHSGIVWHLAPHTLKLPANAEISITQGPSENALARGTTLILNDGLELFNGALIEEETDLICGVYKWLTGMFFYPFLTT